MCECEESVRGENGETVRGERVTGKREEERDLHIPTSDVWSEQYFEHMTEKRSCPGDFKSKSYFIRWLIFHKTLRIILKEGYTDYIGLGLYWLRVLSAINAIGVKGGR